MGAGVVVKRQLGSIFHNWVEDEIRLVCAFAERKPGATMIDLGCGDGRITEMVAKKVQASKVVGVEALEINRKLDIEDFQQVDADLNEELPFDDNSFDVVMSHFSLEHLYNTGLFIKETMRILKPGGYTIVATDNLAAWPNVAALALGWQPFSTTTGITTGAIGNPFALRSAGHSEAVIDLDDNSGADAWRAHGMYSHNKVLSYRAIKEAYTEFGFEVESLAGAGYMFFPSVISRPLCKIDPRHAHLLVLKARKSSK